MPSPRAGAQGLMGAPRAMYRLGGMLTPGSPDSSSSDRSLRIAVLSTPRSGNTWLRHLLASLFDLWQHAVHRPSDLDWDALPERAVVQLHWHRVEPLVSLVEQHRFRVAVLARHP